MWRRTRRKKEERRRKESYRVTINDFSFRLTQPGDVKVKISNVNTRYKVNEHVDDKMGIGVQCWSCIIGNVPDISVPFGFSPSLFLFLLHSPTDGNRTTQSRPRVSAAGHGGHIARTKSRLFVISSKLEFSHGIAKDASLSIFAKFWDYANRWGIPNVGGRKLHHDSGILSLLCALR